MRSLPAPVAFDADDRALLNQTIDYYHQRLLTTSEAVAYLKARRCGMWIRVGKWPSLKSWPQTCKAPRNT